MDRRWIVASAHFAVHDSGDIDGRLTSCRSLQWPFVSLHPRYERSEERDTRERERDKSFAGLPPSVVESHIMRIKFQNCSRLDTGEVIDTKEVR